MTDKESGQLPAAFEDAQLIEGSLRAISSEDLPKVLQGGKSVMQSMVVLLTYAVALKQVLTEGQANLLDIKPPSFVGGEEAADIFHSILTTINERSEQAAVDLGGPGSLVTEENVREGRRADIALWILERIKEMNNDISTLLLSGKPDAVEELAEKISKGTSTSSS